MVAQRRVQLGAPDVDRENHAGAVREQYFGESAGRCADIETDVILDRNRVLLQRARELAPAARHVGVRRLGLQHRVGYSGTLNMDWGRATTWGTVNHAYENTGVAILLEGPWHNEPPWMVNGTFV